MVQKSLHSTKRSLMIPLTKLLLTMIKVILVVSVQMVPSEVKSGKIKTKDKLMTYLRVIFFKKAIRIELRLFARQRKG